MHRIFCFLLSLLLLCAGVTPAFAASEETALGQVQNVTTSLEDGTNVALQWDAVPDATGYKVQLFRENSGKYKTVVTTTATKAAVFSLDKGKTWRFRVRAFHKEDGVVTWGEPSADAFAVTAPGKLKGLTVSDLSKETVTLSWKATKGATHYEVFLYDDAKEDFRLYGLSGYLQMTVKNLSPNSAYRFKVRPFRLDKGKYAAGEMSGELSETTDTNGLPHTEWQAVKAYNAALNAAKSGGSYRLTQKKTVKTTKHSVSRAAFDGTADNLMRLFSGARTRRYTLKNGKTSDGDTALSLLPPFGKTLALTPNDLKSFTAEKKEGGGYVLTLTLNEDVSLFENGKTSRPQVLSKATDYLRFEKLDTTPIRLTSGKVFYDAATLELTLDRSHEMTALKTRVRAALQLDCYAASVPFTAAVAYDCKEQYTIEK